MTNRTYNSTLVQALINPDKMNKNEVSLLRDENRILYFHAYVYANYTLDGRNMSCEEFSEALEMGIRELPLRLADISGTPRVTASHLQTRFQGLSIPLQPSDYGVYMGLAAGLGAYFFSAQAENAWLETYVAFHFTKTYTAGYIGTLV